MEVFLPMASALSMWTRKASHPSSHSVFKCLFSARLLSTCCHPLSSWKKETGISKTSVLLSAHMGGEVCEWMCVTCVSIRVCIYMCVTRADCDTITHSL